MPVLDYGVYKLSEFVRLRSASDSKFFPMYLEPSLASDENAFNSWSPLVSYEFEMLTRKHGEFHHAR